MRDSADLERVAHPTFERGTAMKKFVLGVAVIASLTLLSACSADNADDTVETAAAVATDAASEAAGGASGESTVLLGSVGSADDPEAFVITLTNEAGEEVTTLPAGEYTIQVSDPATKHNFHLVGGSIDETTSVPDTEEVTFEVTFEAGEYTYKCDPHPPMTKTFTVT
ncbi:MAG: cupredoxin domain-containing protein [Cellulomonas sp.]